MAATSITGVLKDREDLVDQAAIIANPAVKPLIPKGVDVTEATLTANWLTAKDY